MKGRQKIGCAALVLTGVIACWVGLSYLLPLWMVSGWYEEGAYVSGRPELTKNADTYQVQEVHKKLAAFFQTHGLTVRDAHDLRLAAGVHYKHGVLFRFGIAPLKRQRLLRGKKPLRVSAGALLQAGPLPEPHIQGADDPEIEKVRADLSYLWTQSPYNRLGWWPPPPEARRGMSVYRVPLDWHQPEISPRHCYFFVSPAIDTVYVAAQGF